MVYYNFMFALVLAICLTGETLGGAQTRRASNSATSRHFFRGHQVPSPAMAIDPLENELHELRALSVMNSTDITSSAPTMSSEIEQALVGPLERQLAEMHEDTSADNTSQSSDATFTPEPMSEDSGSSDEDDEETSTAVSTTTVASLDDSTRTFNSQKRSSLTVEMNKEDEAEEGSGSEERLLQLMVKLAEHPAQWERVHHELEHLDRELLASRRAVQLLGMSRSRDTSTSVPQPLPDALILENEADLASKSTTSSHPPSVERPPQQQQQQHGHHGNHNKQWPQFAYHRVTASPISNSPAASAPPGRHRSAFVAVSAVTPAQQQRPRQMLQQQHVSHHVPPSSTELPDAMDTLLAARTPIREPVISDQRTATGSDAAAEEAAEEREIERIVQSLRATTQHHGGGPWSHQRHRDQMKEQLQALEALHAQIEAKWRAQEDNRGHNK